MKRNLRKTTAKFGVSLAALLAALIGSATAEEDTAGFVIAPPPVGYPAFVPGETITQTGMNGLWLSLESNPGGSSEDFTLLGGTVFSSRQHSFSESLAGSLNLGGSLLMGSDYDMILVNFPMSASGVLRALERPELSLFAFGGLSGALGLSMMSFDIVQPVPYTAQTVTDTVTVRTTMVTASASAGLQANLEFSPFVISPFAVLTWTGGTAETEMESSMSYDYGSGSADIPLSQSAVYGFDVLYEPANLSLSSMLRADRDYTLITVSVRFVSKRYMNGIEQSPR